ncbi:hypothetical protein NDU88_002764 [Pleurodeles waltl]|uniref:Uncharacterized protein n=1 Tax=Pleurodeles waltl TaxID=8319 RepID=A0AAV7UDB3_PLEWA|nr:hypothetical protein NDU88_002764 [Pleurodeles waltl]
MARDKPTLPAAQQKLDKYDKRNAGEAGVPHLVRELLEAPYILGGDLNWVRDVKLDHSATGVRVVVDPRSLRPSHTI